MPHWPTDYQTWSGTLNELVDTANEVLAQSGTEAVPVSVRTVRHYQDRNVIGRGTKEGRSARFTFRDLSSLVSAKTMIGQGLPIDVTSFLLARSAPEDVDASLSSSGQKAADVIAKMMHKANLSSTASTLSASADPVGTLLPHWSAHVQGAAAFDAAAAFSSSTPALMAVNNALARGAKSAPFASSSPSSLSPVSWMQLTVDEAALRAASGAERTRAAHALLNLASRLTAPTSGD